MDNQLLYKMTEEARLQCRFARFAFQNIRAGVHTLDTEKVFFFVDSFLAHADNLSRLLWPRRNQSKGRGEKLRSELKVPDDSPLRLKEMGEQLNSFDERVEDWLEPLENRESLEMNLMPQGTIADFKADNFHRNLDPETFQFSLRGNRCDLRDIFDEIARLDSAIQSWLRTRNPW